MSGWLLAQFSTGLAQKHVVQTRSAQRYGLQWYASFVEDPDDRRQSRLTIVHVHPKGLTVWAQWIVIPDERPVVE